MKNNKMDLIKKAADSAAHKRSNTIKADKKEPTVIVRENMSFYVGDARDVIGKVKKGKLSEAIQRALRSAYKNGDIDDLIGG